MPQTLKELHDYIMQKVEREEVSGFAAHFAVGWIFYDIFEWMDLEKEKDPALTLNSDMIDNWVKQLPTQRIDREVDQASQVFGQAALELAEDDTQQRIRKAIDDSVVAQVKLFTSSWRAFGLNILAGVIAGLIFSALALYLYLFVLVDPSINQRAKEMGDTTPPTSAAGTNK